MSLESGINVVAFYFTFGLAIALGDHALKKADRKDLAMWLDITGVVIAVIVTLKWIGVFNGVLNTELVSKIIY